MHKKSQGWTLNPTLKNVPQIKPSKEDIPTVDERAEMLAIRVCLMMEFITMNAGEHFDFNQQLKSLRSFPNEVIEEYDRQFWNLLLQGDPHRDK